MNIIRLITKCIFIINLFKAINVIIIYYGNRRHHDLGNGKDLEFTTCRVETGRPTHSRRSRRKEQIDAVAFAPIRRRRRSPSLNSISRRGRGWSILGAVRGRGALWLTYVLYLYVSLSLFVSSCVSILFVLLLFTSTLRAPLRAARVWQKCMH
jgi:hypothetical protein